jgi:hypothetical protein
MKRDIQYLQGLYCALFDDLALKFPHLQREFDRDYSRLLSYVEARGLPYLMVDLPAAAKAIDTALSVGFLTPNGLPGFRPASKVGPIPHHFKGLFLEVFDKFGVLRADCSLSAIRALRQIFLMAKKYKIACEDSKTWEHVNEFYTVDREVRSPTLNWDEDELCIANSRHLHFCNADIVSAAPLFGHGLVCHDSTRGPLSIYLRGALDAVQKTADIVSSKFGEFDPAEWRAKHGPGAVADQRHTQFKYDFPNWPAKLEGSFPYSQLAFANYEHWIESLTETDTNELAHESPSKLIAVPKTLKGPRLIAAEPTSHQWCQQILLDFFSGRIKATPICNSVDFRSQEVNRNLALAASLDGSFATIDLSSASDRVSCWVVERMFRRNPSVLLALHASRTRWIQNRIDKKSPQYHKLRKFSSQGSACTFPVESIIFAIIAIGAVLFKRGVPITEENIRLLSREVRVFGDDIVIATDAAELNLEILDWLGNKPNLAKSYLTGLFRESCGMDAYAGKEVTPVYVTSTPDESRPESIISSVDVHNNLYSRGYYNIARYVKSTVLQRRRYLFREVAVGSGTFGWWSDEHYNFLPGKTRFNSFTQKMEAQLDVPKSVSKRDPAKGSGQVLQYFTEAAFSNQEFILGERIGIPVRSSHKIVRQWVPVET